MAKISPQAQIAPGGNPNAPNPAAGKGSASGVLTGGNSDPPKGVAGIGAANELPMPAMQGKRGGNFTARFEPHPRTRRKHMSAETVRRLCKETWPDGNVPDRREIAATIHCRSKDVPDDLVRKRGERRHQPNRN
jgi:hypothetical protein